jgi:hypothetical protein
VQCRAMLTDLLKRAPSQREAMEFGVVTEDGLAVARAADVEFKTISAVFQSQVEGGKRVLRRIEPRAAMSEQQELARQWRA